MKNFVQKGDTLTFTESELSHPTHSDNLVDSGDPVLVGRIGGVAATSAVATTDKIAVAVEGVYNLSVSSVHNGITKGETVFADPATLALSDDLADTPFGIALGTVDISATATIPVKLFGGTPGASGAGS